MQISRVSIILAVALSLLPSACSHGDEKRGRARHVVLIVWDGMRPDFVTEEYAPTLWKLAGEGVTFTRHHSTFPTATNINGTVMATGVGPARSGVIANQEFRPEIDREAPMDTADAAQIRRADELSAGKYLAIRTIAELVQESGRSSAIAGTKWISRIFDRSTNRSSETQQKSPTVTSGTALPESAHRALSATLGAFPAKQLPNAAQDVWTTAALTESFWKDEVPAFSLLWLSDPDFTQHDSAPGSPAAMAAIKNSDAALGRVIAALESKRVRDQTDIFIVSDHGFSTVARAFDIPALLAADGFKATKKFKGEPEAGTILVVGNGGTALFYVIGRDEAITRRLVAWLQQSDFAGVIFTRAKMEGAFALADVHLDKESGPDVVMSFRWNDQPNQFGVPGLIFADWHRGEGRGTHATLSKFDLHNTLVAVGPDFRRGYRDALPTGNIDVAPTILHILGITPPAKLDGRVLFEAMTNESEKIPEVQTEIMEASHGFPASNWRQYLKISRIDEHRYIDEGNGGGSPTDN